MRILDCEQGSPEWRRARLGIPTASNFKLLYTSQGKPSASAVGYRHTLLAERLLGAPTESYESEWMKRGSELEDEARQTYEYIQGIEVERVGVALRDDGRVGGSPDGLITNFDGEIVGGVEIKCPKAATHISFMLKEKCPSSYIPQIQGNMYITGAKRWDLMSYYPGLEPLIVRVARDDEWIAGLEAVLGLFLRKLDEEFARLKGGG